MKKTPQYLSIVLLMFMYITSVKSQSDPTWKNYIGSSYLESSGYEVMGKICDEAGPRMMGSENYNKALAILKAELQKEGLNAKEEQFNTLCWYRGDDEVEMLLPTQRKLKITTVGYVHSQPVFTANVVYTGNGSDEEFKKNDVKGKIVLVAREGQFGRSGPNGPEVTRNAMLYGAKAVLFFNSEQSGFLAIAKTGNYSGDTVKIPVFNITFEEGMWLKRLCEQNKPVELKVNTKSYCKQNKVSNLVVTFPGKVKDRIVVGAHFDSWDLGQGAVDNGLGSAIIFDMARLVKKINPDNYYTIEFVWFTGEELGLVGSKNYVRMHKGEPIIAYLNYDMTGSPVGFNTMGFDEYKPFLEQLVHDLDGFDLKQGVKSNPGTGSDHLHFMLAGIPTLFVSGHLDEIMYKYYHEAGDTWDKFNKKYLSQTVAVSSVLLHELANNSSLKHRNHTETEMVEMLKKFKMDEELKRSGEWIY
jgi:Iap family predicted aminopeptidase